jgi:biotin-dependent carboxylase-like uncharacterized protein
VTAAGRWLLIERIGGLTTVQDLGRPGLAHLGVTRSGAADRAALRLANRLVGNHQSAAGLEVTLGGLTLTPVADITIAVTGALCPIRVGENPVAPDALIDVPAGTPVALGTAHAGLRAYVAVRGGVQVDPVLGSRASDTLSGLGPRPLEVGDLVAVGATDGPDVARWPRIGQVPVAPPPDPGRTVLLDAVPGPRADWLAAEATATLWGSTWTVSAQSDRVGLRLEGAALTRTRDDELASEGLVRGAIQAPPSGPVLLLADHPVTGGYPVVAVLHDEDVDRAAQLRPGQRLRLHRRPQDTRRGLVG